ncbi:reverse transcriptase domain-containing protein [Tanacetum coccineum]|uniref:Reverse transcriptase domain-containing protein n=1 Tax=Tanacetum coccineum TaxID=301880 RepID=A0ABQ5GIJ2_9ASTR
MPNNVKTYDGTGDPEDHVKKFQAATQVERWAMPTWCHMFNTTLIGTAKVWFDELPPESIDGYKDLKAAFLAYFMQQKKYIKDPVEIHDIKQRDGETIEDFMKRFKVKTGCMKGAPECMQISGFMHGVSQGKDGGLAGLPPYQNAQRNPCGRSRKVQTTTTHGNPGGEEKQQQVLRLHNDKGHSMDEWQKVTQSFTRVSKIIFPPLTTTKETEGPLVIEAEIGGHMIHRMYVDGGSLIEVLYEHCFNRLRPEIKNQMVSTTTSLTGFSGETIWPLGQLRLLVTIGDADHSTKAWMNFMIVRSLSPYNGIIGRPGIREIQAVLSTTHGMLKFPVDEGIVTIRSTILIPAECATVTTSSKKILREAEVCHENLKVALHLNFPDQEWQLGGRYPRKIFTCSTEEKGSGLETCQSHLSGVMVKKHDGSWRMCKDFTDLNKACPQDCYPLPEINWKVESLCGYPFKCFLDAYKGYHQIQMAESDEEKTAFHTNQGVYCYTKMPFGLKNAGATYQRLADKAFDSQVGRNIEVYVDDLVIKSHTEAEMLRDIDETFRTLRKINMKLNPKKCTFGTVEGIFLGYMISPEGIKSCPDKTEAVLQLCVDFVVMVSKSDIIRNVSCFGD